MLVLDHRSPKLNLLRKLFYARIFFCGCYPDTADGAETRNRGAYFLYCISHVFLAPFKFDIDISLNLLAPHDRKEIVTHRVAVF